MSVQIDTAFINGYSSVVEHLVRQDGSKLMNTVTIRDMKGEKDFFERIGNKVAQTKAGRHSKVNYTDTPHSRRMVTAQHYYDADLIDKDDEDRMLVDFLGDYQRTQADALGLKMDEVIIAAAAGTAATGKDGTGSAAFDTNMVVDVQVVDEGVSAADAGLNVAKLRKAKRLLDENHVPTSDRFLIVKSSQMESLLGSTLATSADYNSVRALVQGDINTYLGFRFIQSEYGGLDANNDERVWFWHKRGIILGRHKGIMTRVSELPEYHYSKQVYTCMDIGAVRMQEEMVGYIECDPASGATGA